jgi:tRNA pseudouridine38-40 synthase
MSEPAGSPGGLTRFRINLGYDGTGFAGWAKQPGLRTVQGELLGALEQIFGESDNDFGMRVAGRTDAGVHALSQVAHLDLSAAQLKRLGRAKFTATKLNKLLSPDVRVFEVVAVPADFHARYAASGRSYCYRIADTPQAQSPLRARDTLWVAKPLDDRAMNRAAQKLVGLKDFGAFCRPREGATSIRHLRKITVTRDSAGVILVKLEADAFCHNMVRAIVGSLAAVGAGKLTVSELVALQRAAKRTSAFKVMPPNGLTLISVSYPNPRGWAKQAERARAKRPISG